MEVKEKKVDTQSLEARETSRRDFMKTAGKFALYTPPAIMLLMNPSRKAVASSFPGTPDPSNGNGGGGYYGNA